MKLEYERPLIAVELFSLNRAISSCVNANLTFDCMKGGQTDTTNVIIKDTCDNAAIFAEGVTTAYNYSMTRNHSTHTQAIWNVGSKTYTATGTGVKGLLAICADDKGPYSSAEWQVQNDVLRHNTSCRYKHSQIAPVYDADITKANMGS